MTKLPDVLIIICTAEALLVLLGKPVMLADTLTVSDIVPPGHTFDPPSKSVC